MSNIPSQLIIIIFIFTSILFLNCRNCTTSLKECVPVLTSYSALKSQFDWVTDGAISHLVDENLPRELRHLEMYIRYRLIFIYFKQVGTCVITVICKEVENLER